MLRVNVRVDRRYRKDEWPIFSSRVRQGEVVTGFSEDLNNQFRLGSKKRLHGSLPEAVPTRFMPEIRD